MVNPSLDFLP